MKNGIYAILWWATLSAASEWVPFAPPWDDVAPGPTNMSATLHRPAGCLGPVHVKDGHLFAGTQRMRFFGTNLTAAACFPDHDTADKVSARMAKFGFNAVRFHFLDSTWGLVRLLNYESGDWRNWNPEALDRLDYFVARLREHGIYINLNLLVGRRFGVGDGVDAAIGQLNWKPAHAVGFFNAPHLEAQKHYARQLLTHRNPYTKLTYAEDPAVAFVEINNENGLLHTWLGGEFDNLPAVFARDLQQQWNKWLAARYADTAALSDSWQARSEPFSVEMLANASLEQGTQHWSIEQHEGAKVAASVQDGVALLRVENPGSAGWHVQFNQPGLKLAKGSVYTVSFRAAADKRRKIILSLMQAHDPWGGLGLRANLELAKEWQTISFTFVATEDDNNARLNFSELNQAGAEFRFAGLSLKPGGRVGLLEGESLERMNIAAPKASAGRILPAKGRSDWISFLWDTERAHWREMRRFLREDLGVKGLLAGTIVATSTPNLMADLDIVDTHAYWEHPHFPGKSWDRNNWFVRNISMIDHMNKATVTQLALQRVAGKPHMVSEYNHPAPNMHAGEAPIFLAAMAGLQDWDALFLYTYSHEDQKTKAGRIPDFFDIGQHPTIMANAVVASILFRRGDLAPAKQLLTMPLSQEREIELIASHGVAWNVVPTIRMGLNLKNALRARVALDIAAPPGAVQPQDEVSSMAEEVGSDTGELSWRLKGKDQGILELRSPRSKALLGHVDGKTVDLGNGVQVSVVKTEGNWCTVALTLLEGESFEHAPVRALLVATGYTENTAMGWKNVQKTTVGTNWGTSPSLVESIAASIRLPRSPGAPLPKVHSLSDRGQRIQQLEVRAAGENGAEVTIGPPQKTLWYEIEFK